MNELISVIIPVYNVQAYLDAAIQSVLRQTYEELEIILIDDGSTDASGTLCNAYAALDRRIRVIHTPNEGLSKARNRGLDTATGSYVFFLDSDDYLEPDAIEQLYCNLTAHNADISVGSLRDVDENGTVIFDDALPLPAPVTLMDERSFWSFSLTKKTGVMVTSKLYKKSIWNTLRFPEGKIHEDDATLVRIMRQCDSIVCTNRICMNYRIRSGSIMQTAFSEKNLDKLQFLTERVNYFLEKNYYEYCYGTYYAGMELLCRALLSGDKKLKCKAKQRYKHYRTLAKSVSSVVESKKQKCSLWLFSLHLGLYTFIRHKIKKAGN